MPKKEGRPKRNLEDYKDEIIQLSQDGLKPKEIVEHLQQWRLFKCGARTIERRLQEWNQSKRIRTDYTDVLEARVTYLHKEKCLQDHQILKHLHEEGFKIQPLALRRLRRKLNLPQRIYTSEANPPVQYQEEELEKAVKDEINKGFSEVYGQKLLYTRLRRKTQISASRHRVAKALRNVDPEGVHRRLRGIQRKRGQFVTQGKNFIWAMDGHDKLASHSNRTGVAILTMYAEWVKEDGFCPTKVQLDHGGETKMVGELHHELVAIHHPNISIRDTLIYGPSTKNQRIEAWWNQLRSTFGARWGLYFDRLDNLRLWVEGDLPSEIALRAVYTPILRREIEDFKDDWNVHYIRKQLKRPGTIHGQPDEIYWDPHTKDFSLPVDAMDVNRLLGDDFINYDPWEYLPAATLEWCHNWALESDIDLNTLKSGENFYDMTRKHTAVYLALREATTHHLNSRLAPELSLLETPEGNWDWPDRQRERAQIQYEANEEQLPNGYESGGSVAQVDDQAWDNVSSEEEEGIMM
ncbi:MAG: hypothetical protein MMC33_010483 [Icmadophila ericetorum]|nr:hypothetical protein [Icmadophila ericetorum]